MHTTQATVICGDLKAELIAVKGDDKALAVDGTKKRFNHSYIVTLSVSQRDGGYREEARAQLIKSAPARQLLTRVIAENARLNRGLVITRMQKAFAEAEQKHPV